METNTLVKIVGLILAFPIGSFIAYALADRVPFFNKLALKLSEKVNVDLEKKKKEEIINDPDLLAKKLQEGGKAFYEDKEKDIKFIDEGNELRIRRDKNNLEITKIPLPPKPKEEKKDPKKSKGSKRPGSSPGAGRAKKKGIAFIGKDPGRRKKGAKK